MSREPRPSAFARNLEVRCVAEVERWQGLTEPSDVDEAVTAFVPNVQPQRAEALRLLVQIMKLTPAEDADDDELMATVIHAATQRIVDQENAMGRRSISRRVTKDETLDLVKIVLVGDSGVGKSCFMIRFIKDQFVTSTRATVGMDFCMRQLSVDMMQGSESSVVAQLTVQVWDTAGQEQFRSLAATYYRRAGGVMILYDANVRSSFESVQGWFKEVSENSEDACVMIVASKVEGQTEVNNAEGEALAQELGCTFASVSSKEGHGVIPAFKVLSEQVLQRQEVAERRSNAIKESISLADERPCFQASGARKQCC